MKKPSARNEGIRILADFVCQAIPASELPANGLQPARSAEAAYPRITRNPAIMGGKPCIRSVRVTVGTVLGLFAAGRSRDEILLAFPYLEPEDIQQALAYAQSRLDE